jgi:hypothetical protein
VNKFDEIFSGYQTRQVSVWNRHFEDHVRSLIAMTTEMILETSVQYRQATQLNSPIRFRRIWLFIQRTKRNQKIHSAGVTLPYLY